jgi:transposase
MSRPHKFIENVSTDAIEALKSGYHHGLSPDYRKRCHGVLLNIQGHQIKEIAEILNCTTQSVYVWIRNWQKSGIEGLSRKSGQGRKPKLVHTNNEHIQVVQAAVANHPQSSAQILAEVKEKLSLEDLSEKSLSRFLKTLVTGGNGSEKD